MEFALNDDQNMLRESVARFVARSYDFETRRKRAREHGGFLRECWNSFAEMGWLAVTIPEQLGGAGFGPIEAAIIAEELGRGLVLEPFVMCGLFPAALLARCVEGKRRQELLGALGSGEVLFAVAHSEPELRGRLAPLATTARRQADGGYRIDGHKSLAIGAPVADRLLVLAASDDGGAMQLFQLDRDAAGVRLETYALLDGTPAADVMLDGVHVPPEALLSGAEDALGQVQAAIDETLVACCAELIGDMEDAIALTSDYIKTRKQFGVAIGSFQALQHRMADMAIELSQARASLHRALAAVTGPGSARERSVIVSGCKAQLFRSAHFVTSQAIQLHGGYGITEEYKVGHHFRRLLILDPLFGDARHHLGRYTAWLQQAALAGNSTEAET